MGRKTYESIGRPLPNRINIVITRAKDFHAEGIKVVNSLPAALELAAAETLIAGAEEVIVIGGAEIYKLCLPLAERLYVTLVHADVDGDARFPEWDRQAYQEIGREDFSADGPNPYDYSFVVFDKIRH